MPTARPRPIGRPQRRPCGRAQSTREPGACWRCKHVVTEGRERAADGGRRLHKAADKVSEMAIKMFAELEE